MKLDEIIIVAINFIFTAIMYTFIPLLLVFKFKRSYNDKKALQIAIINSICVAIFFTILRIIISQNKVNIGPALFWGFVNYCFLRKSKSKITSNNNTDDKDEQLQKLINSLQEENKLK